MPQAAKRRQGTRRGLRSSRSNRRNPTWPSGSLLADFDAVRKASSNAEALAAAMKVKYPTLAVQGILCYAARMAFKG
jgi:hypothetical protein